MKMEKIFPKASEKLVSNVVLYAKSESNKLKLYYDSAKTVSVNKDELINLFKKNLILVNNGDDFFKPTKLATTTQLAKVSVVDYSSSAAVLVEFESKERA